MREIYAGRGNGSGQQPFALLFGLGQNTGIDSVKVYWPDAKQSTTTIFNPDINQYLTIGPEANGSGDYNDPVHIVTASSTESVLKVYPNPAKDFVLLQTDNNSPVSAVALYDITGRQLQVPIYNRNSNLVFCSTAVLQPGLYVVNIQTKNGKVYRATFSKK